MENFYVIFAASEASPFLGTGGLKDVAGSLPKALVDMGVDCRIIIPCFNVDKAELQFIKDIYVPVAWRSEYCGLFMKELAGVTYYFIDNERYFFNRDALYGEYDDAERFTFFSRAICEILPHLPRHDNKPPDIVICNDWQTALVSLYLKVIYPKWEWYSKIKTISMIHNIAFQGKYGMELLEDVFGLPDTAKGLVEYDECINLLKGGMEASDYIVTVSPNYAEEISGNHPATPDYDFGWRLTPFIESRKYKLAGILNGIDNDTYNPDTDPLLYKNYNAFNFREGKNKNKLELQKVLGLEVNAETFLIGVVGRIDPPQKGFQLILEALNNGLLENNKMQLAFLGSPAKGDSDGDKMADEFKNIASRYPGKMAARIEFSKELGQKIYGASDIFLVPSQYEPCGLSQMIALRYGTVPIVRNTGGLADTVFDNKDGDGNGYTFDNYSAGELMKAIERAFKCYADPERWNSLVKRAMAYDYSWNNSVKKHIDLFRKICV